MQIYVGADVKWRWEEFHNVRPLQKELRNVVHCHMMWEKTGNIQHPMTPPPRRAHILPTDVVIPQTLQSASPQTNWYSDANCKCPGHAEWKIWNLLNGSGGTSIVSSEKLEQSSVLILSESELGLCYRKITLALCNFKD